MFVSVARVTLQIPDAGSLKAKRQVLRRVTDRVKARFNASVAEVDDHDLWQKAQVAVAVIASDKRHAQEQVDKILHFIEELYVAPVISREVETVAFGRDLYGGGVGSKPDVDAADREDAAAADLGDALDLGALGLRGDRSLAEVEGLGAWHERHEAGPGPAGSGTGSRGQTSSGKAGRGKGMSDDDVRARARALRNPRDWEKK